MHDVADQPRTTRTDLPAIHGMGTKAMRILDEELRARGLTFLDG